jgi:hypothetical protein
MSAAAIVHPRLAKARFEMAIRPLLEQPERYEKAAIKLVAFSFPSLDVELSWHSQGAKLLLRVDGTDYRFRPAGGWWIDALGEPLVRGQRVPEGNGFHTQRENGLQRCWFCFPGWREYHDHSSHQDLSWASIRRDPRYGVLQLVQQLHKDLNSAGVGKV